MVAKNKTQEEESKIQKTNIEWVKNPDGSQGFTWNSKTGCKNHTPEGLCLGGLFPCYAYRLAHGRLGPKYLAHKNLAPHTYNCGQIPGVSLLDIQRDAIAERSDPFYPRWWPERLGEIKRRKTPSGIFLDDMSDWMGDYWPEEWTEQELQTMRDCPQHRFYLLTKQPQNLAKFSPFPSNCWIGVTATGPTMFAEACYKLKCIDAKVKFISLEPLLDFQPLPEVLDWKRWIYTWLLKGGINQLIIGAQTKPYKQPKIEWVREIVEAADRAGIAVFLKDNLKPLLKPLPGNLRQEMPND